VVFDARAGEDAAEIVVRLYKEIARIINMPDIREKLKDLGSDPGGQPPEEFGRFVAAENAKYGKLIREMGLSRSNLEEFA